MDTIVTGIFPNQTLASTALEELVRAGFTQQQVRLVDAESSDRHQFIHDRIADTSRALRFGVVFGGVLGMVTGLLLSNIFGLVPALVVGGLAGALGGTILGFFVGRATTTQVETEVEHQVDAGTVLVSVTTDGERGPRALEVLAKQGAVNMVSTATTFTAGVLPIDRPGAPQESLPPTNGESNSDSNGTPNGKPIQR